MTTPDSKTPGVYIEEINAFPSPVVPVATAVPAFVGYTPAASYQGRPCHNQAQKITSFAEFKAIYMLEDPPAPADPAVQYHPGYYLVENSARSAKDDCLQLNNQSYALVPDPSTIYYLYNSIRLFYENGGCDAYIVSVGPYGAAEGRAGEAGAAVVNPNVKLSDLLDGIAILGHETEPTLYLCPDATLLSLEDNATLMQSLLQQAREMKTALCLFDVIGGDAPDPALYGSDIAAFRNSTGSNGLEFGAAYYPFIGTRIMQHGEINFTNLFGGDIKQLASILSPASSPNPAAQRILGMVGAPGGSMTHFQLSSALLNVSKTYRQIIDQVLYRANMLPPSGAVAGVYTQNDIQNGVWKSPANLSIVGAVSLPIHLSDSQQADLNVDAMSGKSVNAIRFFDGRGILIWGARTLDGNSNDWRYISVRRTLSFLEQSIRLAIQAFVFEPNTANTWNVIRGQVSRFLSDVWKEGGLYGSSPTDAYQIECGLGSTMTADDLLNGRLRLSVRVAVMRPAEYRVITVEQDMAKSG